MAMFLAQVSLPPLTAETVLSVLSAAVTGYFWLIRSRQERPHLDIFQLRDFRPTFRHGDGAKKTKRLSLTQVELGGLLIANHSVRQNSIVRFDCFLHDHGSWLKGTWGYMNEDKPPWNIAPNATIAISPACFFEVPESYEPPDDLQFRLEFITASGRRFAKKLSLRAPEL
jgi:hypothetical protein